MTQKENGLTRIDSAMQNPRSDNMLLEAIRQKEEHPTLLIKKATQ